MWFLLCCRKNDIYQYVEYMHPDVCVFTMHVMLINMYIKGTVYMCVCVCMWTCGHTNDLIIVNCKYVHID